MSKPRTWVPVALLGAALSNAAACSASTSREPHPASATSSSADATTNANAISAPASRGLDDPGNDPAIVTLAKGVLGCHWKIGHGYSKDCPPGVAWYETDLFRDEKSLPTLVSLLEDADPAVRALAAEALRVHGHMFDEDPALSARVLGAAERERDPAMLEAVGELAGAIDLERTGLVDRGLALAKTAPIEVRAAQITGLASANPYSMSVFTFVRSALHDPEPRVRAAAIESLQGSHDTEVCELLEGELGADAEQASLAARALTYGGNGNCARSFDAVLGWLEKRRAAGSLEGVPELAARLCEDREASVAQEARGAKLLRGLVSDAKLEARLRVDALESLPKCDVDSAGFAAKVVTDDEDLKRVAAEVASAPSLAKGPAPDTIGPDAPEPPAIDAKEPVRSLDAVTFLSTWDSVPPETHRDTFPPGLYRIDGVVIRVEHGSQGRVSLSLAGPPGTAVHLKLTASQASAASRVRRGGKAKAVCTFRGDGGRGHATFEDCHWEG